MLALSRTARRTSDELRLFLECGGSTPLLTRSHNLRLMSEQQSRPSDGREVPSSRPSRPNSLVRAALTISVLCGIGAFVPSARAEYIVLRSGQRLVVTGYQLIGNNYKLQMAGGTVELAASEVIAIEPEETFTPEPKPAAITDVGTSPSPKMPFRELVDAAAARYSVDADLVYSVMAAESNFDPKAISSRNARGLMQLMPETASRLGVKNVFDPRENIDAGTRYLGELLGRYNNDLVLTLAAYNAGPQRVAQYGSRIPPYAETQSYIRRVKQNYSRARSTAANASKAEQHQKRPSAQSAPHEHVTTQASAAGTKTNSSVAGEKSAATGDHAKP